MTHLKNPTDGRKQTVAGGDNARANDEEGNRVIQPSGESDSQQELPETNQKNTPKQQRFPADRVNLNIDNMISE